MSDEDYQTAGAMVRYGGSFVEALGRAARYADEDNLVKLKEAFPVEWLKYSELAKLANVKKLD